MLSYIYNPFFIKQAQEFPSPIVGPVRKPTEESIPTIVYRYWAGQLPYVGKYWREKARQARQAAPGFFREVMESAKYIPKFWARVFGIGKKQPTPSPAPTPSAPIDLIGAIRRHPIESILLASSIIPLAAGIGASLARPPRPTFLERMLGRMPRPRRLRSAMLFGLLGAIPALTAAGIAYEPQIRRLLRRREEPLFYLT